MNRQDKTAIEQAKQAAVEILLHNAHGPYQGLPRTAGWGYPEPYTRDLMISSLGILVSGNKELIQSLRKVLICLAKNQTPRGHIPSLVHNPEDRGASDTTPLFLMAVGLFRKATSEKKFLEPSVQKALKWMEYQSPSDRVMVAHLPTSDWRDEQWVLGFGLYVNTIVYCYLRLLGYAKRAEWLKEMMGRFTITAEKQHRHVHEGLVLRHKPYYAMWSYKLYQNERFDLLGNSLAILGGIASPSRRKQLITWIETECNALRRKKELAVGLPPNMFPYIRPENPDWLSRYQSYNQPGEYHNGGIWPYVCGFYIAALVAARRHKLANLKLLELTNLVKESKNTKLEFGFNEWFRAQDGTPQGQDWQSWSAAMYLYAVACVERNETPFFDELRE